MRKLTESDLIKLKLLYGQNLLKLTNNEYYAMIVIGYNSFKLIGSDGEIGNTYISFNELNHNNLICETSNRLQIINPDGIFETGLSDMWFYRQAKELIIIADYNSDYSIMTNGKNKTMKLRNPLVYNRIVYLGNNQYGLLDVKDRTKMDVINNELQFVKHNVLLDGKFKSKYRIKSMNDIFDLNIESVKLAKQIS